MIENLYIEKRIINSVKVKKIISKVNAENIVECDTYRQIFNVKNQSFILQKKKPSMILAEKTSNLVLRTPENFCLDSKNNYYFSHMLNCIFDCNYCFLQGMYRSANYVIFTNFNSFMNEIKRIAKNHKNESVYFFSGYDCDSLALENITNFAENFIPFFNKIENAYLELRTKSINIKPILNFKPSSNIILAWSLNPKEIVYEYENKTPSLKKRLETIKKLQQIGWPIGLRFDPIIFHKKFENVYSRFFSEIFSFLDSDKIHSVTIGTLRFPKNFFKSIKEIGDKRLFSFLEFDGKLYNYENTNKKKLLNFCYEKLLRKIDKKKIFFN